MNAATILLILIAVVGGVPQSSKRTSNQSSVARELQNIEHRLVTAWLKGDRGFVERTLADDWTVTDFSGRVLNKRQVIEEGFASKDRRIISAELDDLRVRVYGESAVVTGKSKISGEYRGTAVNVVTRFTDVFVRRAMKWQAVASQATRLAE
jgi:ketosteroid isomerase-like protein